ncbi:3-isopropylmalate dehydratase small subunit [Halalkalirubrum salinum]|uniref:3-isopropylmalate dehydratase small subunit n=1 Tax=Halalkalirubrum salinum TaxID=2563889 RepID=UPI0010FB00D1|nr:3-isopropylmalate dehydratase small subunit [Halalkalirubrum salinum]
MAGVPQIRRIAGTGVPIRGDDIDTDQILPARFMKEVTFDNMGEYAFYDARRDENGVINDHPLNTYTGANIAVVNRNFGCGSSREHAPQGLMRWGMEGIVGESFAEIFRDNCKSLGVPAMTADAETVDRLQTFIEENPEAGIELDVREKTITFDGEVVDAEIDHAMREALLEGTWDTTAVMRSNMDRVRDVANSLPYVEDR